MGQLVFQATLGGQVNLVGPNTASTFNINVPAVAGTMVTTGDTATVTNAMISGPVSIAKGGTNQTAFTSPAASVNGLVWFDGTSFQNDSTTSHVGYNASTNVFYANTPTFSGDTTLATGNLVIGTSGKGIDFSATAGTGTSELLADYEEGTWQPTLAGSTTTGNYVYHSGGRDGHYTKIGDMVYITCIIYIQSVSTAAAGNLSITGLPFTVKNTTYDMYSAQIPQWGGLASDIVHVGCLFTKNATTIQLYKKESSASSNTPKLEGADIGAETSFRIFGFYKV